MKPGESITIKLFDKCEGCDVVDKCENLGECQKDPYIQARKAYKRYRDVYKEFLEYLDAPDTSVNSYKMEKLSLHYHEAHENLLKAFDELFGHCC